MTRLRLRPNHPLKYFKPGKEKPVEVWSQHSLNKRKVVGKHKKKEK